MDGSSSSNSTSSLETMIKDLQAELKQRDEQHQRQLKSLEEKIDKSSQRSRSTRRSKLQVPSLCRFDFRKWYKSLKKESHDFPGFNVTESIESSSNQSMVIKVIEAVEDDHNGRENCPWSRAQLKGAAMTYYKSQSQASKRKQDGTKDKHKQLCRRQGRMRDKLQRRLKGLQLQSTWTSKKKESVMKVMTAEYMSSDESDMSEDDYGPIIRGYKTKKLPWERSVLTKVKKELDRSYYKSLPRRTRSAILRRSSNDAISSRPAPVDFVSWAVRVESRLSSSGMSTSNSSTDSFNNIALSPIY